MAMQIVKKPTTIAELKAAAKVAQMPNFVSGSPGDFGFHKESQLGASFTGESAPVTKKFLVADAMIASDRMAGNLTATLFYRANNGFSGLSMLADIEFGNGGVSAFAKRIQVVNGISFTVPGRFCRINLYGYGVTDDVTFGGFVSLLPNPINRKIYSGLMGCPYNLNGANVPADQFNEVTIPAGQFLQLTGDEFPFVSEFLLESADPDNDDLQILVQGSANIERRKAPGDLMQPPIPILGDFLDLRVVNNGGADATVRPYFSVEL